MQSFSFYHQHLENVSRSFSFCIRELTSPTKEWVALSYLLLRVVDTVEDSWWEESKAQDDCFQTFKLFLIKTPSEKQFLDWFLGFPGNVSPAEKNLLMDLPLLLEDMKQLPDEIKEELVNTIEQMSDGMSYFLHQYKMKDKLVFPSLITINQYCFFVAGIVGKLLSRIFTYVITDFKWTTTLLNQSFHFGLFLQKINILKDKMSDEANGRCYVSSRSHVRDSLAINALHALDYLKSIPVVEGRSYRLFCAWSLFIGLASLKWIDKNWQLQQDKYKIQLKETQYIINQINQLIDDNHALEKLFHLYLPGQDKTLKCHNDHQVPRMPIWFHAIYPDNQELINWFELGMIHY